MDKLGLCATHSGDMHCISAAVLRGLTVRLYCAATLCRCCVWLCVCVRMQAPGQRSRHNSLARSSGGGDSGSDNDADRASPAFDDGASVGSTGQRQVAHTLVRCERALASCAARAYACDCGWVGGWGGVAVRMPRR